MAWMDELTGMDFEERSYVRALTTRTRPSWREQLRTDQTFAGRQTRIQLLIAEANPTDPESLRRLDAERDRAAVLLGLWRLTRA